MALGKHLFVAHDLAPKIAEQPGNALVYPTMPFAPTGDWGRTEPGVIDPAKKSSHMRYAGSVSISEETFAAVAHDVSLSAIAAGFKNVVLAGDHGGGQSTLAKVAEEMNMEWGPKGIHVYYIPDLYYSRERRDEGLPTETRVARRFTCRHRRCFGGSVRRQDGKRGTMPNGFVRTSW
jgi:hypothetical protein